MGYRRQVLRTASIRCVVSRSSHHSLRDIPFRKAIQYPDIKLYFICLECATQVYGIQLGVIFTNLLSYVSILRALAKFAPNHKALLACLHLTRMLIAVNPKR